MAVMYKLYQNNQENPYKKKGQWYARAVHTQVVNTDVLADRIQRNCTVKRSDVLAVIAELVEVMQDELQQSHVVKLDGFGLFKIGISSKPALKPSEFSVVKNIVNYRVNFLPETRGGGKGKKRSRKFLDNLHVTEAPKNAVDTSKKPGKEEKPKTPEAVEPTPIQ